MKLSANLIYPWILFLMGYAIFFSYLLISTTKRETERQREIFEREIKYLKQDFEREIEWIKKDLHYFKNSTKKN